jgi:hypothetical protein
MHAFNDRVGFEQLPVPRWFSLNYGAIIPGAADDRLAVGWKVREDFVQESLLAEGTKR